MGATPLVVVALLPLLAWGVDLAGTGGEPLDVSTTDVTDERVRHSSIWHPNKPRLFVKNLFWSHVPKTSTSFGRTFFSYTCGEKSDPDFAGVNTCQPAAPQTAGVCTGNLAKDEDALVNMTIKRVSDAKAQNETYYLTWYHVGLPYEASAPDEQHATPLADNYAATTSFASSAAAPSPSSSASPPIAAVMMFREPTDRMRSEYQQLVEVGYKCCTDNSSGSMDGNNWGWNRHARLAGVNAAKGKHFAPESSSASMNAECMDSSLSAAEKLACYAHHAPFDKALHTPQARVHRYREALKSHNALYGCHTKMLLGYGCHESHVLTDAELARARNFVLTASHKRLFVGLLHRYTESVCLFHAQLGGPLWDFEVTEPPKQDPVASSRHSPVPHTSPGEAAHDALFDENGELVGYTSDKSITNQDFDGGYADPDTEIYAMAEARFELALAHHRQEVDECLVRVQPFAATPNSAVAHFADGSTWPMESAKAS